MITVMIQILLVVGGYSLLSVKDRYALSISEIEYSDAYEKNSILFDKGISILQSRLDECDFSEFSLEEMEVLEAVYSLI